MRLSHVVLLAVVVLSLAPSAMAVTAAHSPQPLDGTASRSGQHLSLKWSSDAVAGDTFTVHVSRSSAVDASGLLSSPVHTWDYDATNGADVEWEDPPPGVYYWQVRTDSEGEGTEGLASSSLSPVWRVTNPYNLSWCKCVSLPTLEITLDVGEVQFTPRVETNANRRIGFRVDVIRRRKVLATLRGVEYGQGGMSAESLFWYPDAGDHVRRGDRLSALVTVTSGNRKLVRRVVFTVPALSEDD